MLNRAWLLSSILWLTPLFAHASIVVALPEPELIAKSDTIVFGVVLHTRVVLHEPQHAIGTEVEMQVYQGVRGPKTGEIIVFEVPGGRLANGLVAVASGSPTFSPGDVIFGFMETGGGVRRPIGMSYGILRAQPDKNGRYLLYRELADLILVDPKGAPVDPNGTVIHGLPLEEMVARVNRRLVEIGVPGPGEVRP
jgi:hypothetical protein